MRTAEARALAERIRRFVQTSLTGPPSEPFEHLALAIAAHQRTTDPILAALYDGSPSSVADLPAVPVDLFKQLPIVVADRATGIVYRTSGTTRRQRGEHWMVSDDLYAIGAVSWARHCVPGLPVTTRALLLDPTRHPDSSLSHMVAMLSGPDARYYLEPSGLDRERLEADLATCDAPVFVPATAFAAAEWLEDGTPAVPMGSVVMVTGGFKGRLHALDDHTLYEALARRLPGARVVTEYGMSELSSQLWGTSTTPYRPPPWLLPLACSPWTGEVLPAGEAGQLRFVDLCNLDSAVAIETLDEGIVHADGSVTLHGRLPGAAIRGCSLTVEETWARGAQ